MIAIVIIAIISTIFYVGGLNDPTRDKATSDSAAATTAVSETAE